MPHEEWIEIPLPLIVDPAVFEAARTQLEENRKRKRERIPGNIVQVLVENATFATAVWPAISNATPRLSLRLLVSP